MEYLIGALLGFWVLATIFGTYLVVEEIVKSDLTGGTKFACSIWVSLGNLYAILTIAKWVLLLVDKL